MPIRSEVDRVLGMVRAGIPMAFCSVDPLYPAYFVSFAYLLTVVIPIAGKRSEGSVGS